MDYKEAIAEKEQEIADKNTELKDLDNWEGDEDDYNEFIDSCYNEVDVIGMTYPMSSVLKGVDEVRYNMGKSEWEEEERERKRDEIESEISDLEYDLEELKENLNQASGVKNGN